MSINVGIGLVGAALQADDNTPAAAPAYAHGLTGGSPISIERSASSASVACGVRTDIDGYVESIDVSPSFETLGYADVLPLYYYAALGKIVSAAGSTAGTYTHTVTLGDALPSLTVWGQVGAGNFGRTDGCKVSALNMSLTGNEPASFSVETAGKNLTFLDATPFTGVDPSCFDGYFVPTEGTFLLDTAGSSPAAAVITEASIDISNDVEAFRGLGQVMPASIGEKKLTVSPSFTVVPDDITPYRKMVTGSANGTTPSGSMVYGSARIVLQHSVNPNFTIAFDIPRIPFTADFVDVDPDGGNGEFTFTADSAYATAAGGTPVTVTITNGVESYAA